jgi:8-oxo-dGTP pyrophosphatase MutT (NUDIX family)
MAESDSQPPRRGVVAVILRGEQFLVIRRSQHVRAPGMHCFPGGAIEPGESEEEALCRELSEELDLSAQPLRRLWESVTPWNVALTWWLAGIDAQALPIPNPLEVESFHWLTAAEIRALPNLLASNLEFLEAWERGPTASATDENAD